MRDPFDEAMADLAGGDRRAKAMLDFITRPLPAPNGVRVTYVYEDGVTESTVVELPAGRTAEDATDMAPPTRPGAGIAAINIEEV